ncbi:MAG: ABC transporter permease [Pseudomonadales bacterium]|nr:ABC transporter permease [Pseudomonadales bacterium]
MSPLARLLKIIRFSPLLDTLIAFARWPSRRVFQKQLYFSGLESLPLLLIIGALAGTILCAELHHSFGQSTAYSLHLVAIIGGSELAPLLTALIMIARSASAMASELATMRVHGEVRQLQFLGIDLTAYLLLPRLTSMCLARMLLVIYFSASMLLAGSIELAGFDSPELLSRLAHDLSLTWPLIAIAKSALLGLATAAVACREGLDARNSSMTDIPKASSRAVVKALLLIFVLDAAWAALP